MWKSLLIGSLLTGLVVGMVLQQRALRALRSEVAQMTKGGRSDSADLSAPSTANAPTTTESIGHDLDNNPIPQRLSNLEVQVRQLTIGSELLMEKGDLPLSETKTAQLKRKFLDTSLPDRVRLEALRVLRRNNAVDDDILQAGLTWIDALSDARLMGDVLEQLNGLKHPVLREKLLQIVTTHPDERLRQRAAQGLAVLMDDLAVESAVWKALASEQSQTELQRRTLDTEASFRERLTAFRTMTSTKVADAQTTAAFANDVVNQNRSEEIAELFRSLDNTGNLAAAPALIKGLQTGGPELRALALYALSEMQSDAAVVKWLQYTANNDSDERVRAEATRVLSQAGNRPQ